MTTVSQGGIRLLIQDVYYPNIRQESISIAQTANDPIPTFSFLLQDDPSQVAISELQEVVFLDAGEISNPTHNLLKNPVINPYNTSWTVNSVPGWGVTQLSPGVTMSATNITLTYSLAQITGNGLVVAGQFYMFSCTVQATTLTSLTAFVAVSYLNAVGTIIQTNTTLIGVTATAPFTIATQAPNTATSAQISFGLMPITNTNSGAATFKSMQFEPMSFTSGLAQISYPSAFCANGQVNCVLLPDGTTIRQYRLFGGLVTKATAGHYIGNNRQWNVSVSGYIWLLQKQLLPVVTYTNKTDAFIINDLVTTYFPNQFSTAQVAIGATLDSFGYAYNGTARDALDTLASNSGFFYYANPYRVIFYQPPGYNQTGFLLSDDPDSVTSFPYYAYSLDIDGTQLGNACLVTGATNISAIEYDAQSIGYYNQKTGGLGVFWRTASDGTITTAAGARQRAIAEIAQYNYARKIVHCTTQQLMIPGYTVLFSSVTDNLFDVPLLIQKNTLVLKGFTSLQQAYYECQCDLGDFNPDFVNIIVKLKRKQLTNTASVGTPAIGLMVTENTTYIDIITIRTVTGASSTYGMGVYGTSVYAFAIPSVPTTKYGAASAIYGSAAVGYN